MKQLKYYLIVIALLIVAVKVCGDQAEKEPENLYTEQRESHDAVRSSGEHTGSREKTRIDKLTTSVTSWRFPPQ